MVRGTTQHTIHAAYALLMHARVHLGIILLVPRESVFVHFPLYYPSSRLTSPRRKIYTVYTRPPRARISYIPPPLLRIVLYTLSLVIHPLPPQVPRASTNLPPQPLQLPQHNQIRIQKPIHALPHAGLLVFVQLSVLHAASGDALLEAGVCQAVDGCFVTG
jgi:hypothetical protein